MTGRSGLLIRCIWKSGRTCGSDSLKSCLSIGGWQTGRRNQNSLRLDPFGKPCNHPNFVRRSGESIELRLKSPAQISLPAYDMARCEPEQSQPKRRTKQFRQLQAASGDQENLLKKL